MWTMAGRGRTLLRLDSDTFYINHVTAVMVDNLRRLLLGINLSDKAVMDFDFPGVGFPIQFVYQDTVDKLMRSEEHTSELQSRFDLVCRLLLEKKKQQY